MDRQHLLQNSEVNIRYKKDVDRTLLRENLKLTVEQRFDSLMEM